MYTVGDPKTRRMRIIEHQEPITLVTKLNLEVQIISSLGLLTKSFNFFSLTIHVEALN